MTLMSIPDICPSLAHKTAGCGHRNVRTSLPLLWLYHTRERPAPACDVAQAWKGAALSATPDRVAECRGRGERRGSTGLNRFHRIGFHDYGQFHSWGYIAGAMVSRVRNSRGRPKSASTAFIVPCRIVNTVGPIRQVTQGEEVAQKRYLVIATGTHAQPGELVQVQTHP